MQIKKRDLFQLLGYEPHPGQMLVHKSRKPRRILAVITSYSIHYTKLYEEEEVRANREDEPVELPVEFVRRHPLLFHS